MLNKYIIQFNQVGAVYLKIKARSSAGKTVIKQIMKDSDGEIIKIDVAAPALKGKANAELITFLAREFAINKGSVKIIAGAGDRIKLVKIVK